LKRGCTFLKKGYNIGIVYLWKLNYAKEYFAQFKFPSGDKTGQKMLQNKEQTL
jgi:hypothetical protein